MGYDRRNDSATVLERVRYITGEEYKKLLQRSKRNPRAYLLFLVLGNAGLRVGEAHRLVPKDIADDRPVIRVQTERQGDNVIHDLVIARKAARKIREVIRLIGIRVNEKLFPWTIRNSQKLWYKYSTQAGLRILGTDGGKGRGIHCLRHMLGIRMAEANLPPVFILKQLRQKSFLYLDRYLQTIETRRMMENIGAIC
jgi:integrase